MTQTNFISKGKAPILCCIGVRAADSEVRDTALQMASAEGIGWHALHVTPVLRLSPAAARTAHEILQRAAQLGATTAIRKRQDVAGAIIEYARDNAISRIVLGDRSTRNGRGLGEKLMRRAPELELVIVPALRQEAPERQRVAAKSALGMTGGAAASYLLSLLTLSVVTAIELLRLVDPVSLAMLMVLSVALVALGGGRRAAIATAIGNLAIYDYLVVPPRYSFALQDTHYIVTFAVMLTVGGLIGELTARLRVQARIAQESERRAHALSAFSRALSAQGGARQVIDVAERTLSRAFASVVVVIASNAEGELDFEKDGVEFSDDDKALARQVFAEQRVLGSEDLPGLPHWGMIPLRSSLQTRGVVAISIANGRRATLLEDIRELDTYASLIGLALERVHYVALSQDALLAIESERLRNSLLAALSHDLRTPLSGVIGLAESILYTRPSLSTQQREMIEEIVEEGQRMSASVDNLLEMAKLESGTVVLRMQWQSVEEVIGSALANSRRSLALHKVMVDIEPHLPLVQFDAALVTRVLVNLLENAAKYTPVGAEISIAARLCNDCVELSVADDGPGLPAGQEEALFAKFARGQSESATGGMGLGLAICRSIVQAHGGAIVAETGRSVGARFIMTLPLGEPPPVMGELETLANDT